ncbi:MAG: Sodium Bile acid symporter family protein [Methanosaeta sp. PtaU1.Bin055]|nr:MAG: Sodium Bile acid symporter family protein [Methanosaeta sp. PtaU1.Bin055]
MILAAAIGLLRPPTFKLFLPHVPLLLGVIIFGMGMILRAEEFRNIFAQPKVVAYGVFAQYTIMPLIA